LLDNADSKLEYGISSINKGHKKRIDAVRIVISTNRSVAKHDNVYLAEPNRSTFTIPGSSEEVPLATNERIIQAHYGYESFTTEKSELAHELAREFTRVYVIPMKLGEVRPKDMDLPYIDSNISDCDVLGSYSNEAKKIEDDFYDQRISTYPVWSVYYLFYHGRNIWRPLVWSGFANRIPWYGLPGNR